MGRYRLEFIDEQGNTGARQSFPVPDIITALAVADINMLHGIAEVIDGDKVVATLEKRGRNTGTFWHVS